MTEMMTQLLQNLKVLAHGKTEGHDLKMKVFSSIDHLNFR